MSSKRTSINFLKAGMGIEEGTLIRWLKEERELVNKGDVVAEVETAKALQDIEAPISGRLVTILVKAGESIAVNTALGVIQTEDHHDQ